MTVNSDLLNSCGKLTLYADIIRGYLKSGVEIKDQVHLLRKKDKNLKTNYRSYLNLVKRYFEVEYEDYHCIRVLKDATMDIKEGLNSNLSYEKIYSNLEELGKTNYRGQGKKVTFVKFTEYITSLYSDTIKSSNATKTITKKKKPKETFDVVNPISVSKNTEAMIALETANM